MRPRPSESAAKEVERMHSGISTTLRNLFVGAALALGVGSATGQPTGPLEAAIEEGWTQPRTSSTHARSPPRSARPTSATAF